MAPRDQHPLVIALVDAWARRAGYDPDDVWRWLRREAAPPARFVAGAVEAFFPLVRAEDFGPLPSSPKGAIDRHMGQANLARYRKERTVGRPIVSEHPFPRALRDANVTVTEWATAHGVSRSQVKSWFLDGGGARPIPKKHAEAIRKEFAVPLTAWGQIKD